MWRFPILVLPGVVLTRCGHSGLSRVWAKAGYRARKRMTDIIII
jgi:hypothetical protein